MRKFSCRRWSDAVYFGFYCLALNLAGPVSVCTFVLAFKNLYCAPSSRHTRTHFIFLHKHSCTYTQRTFSVSTLCIFMQMLELTFIWSRCVCSHQRDFYLPTASCCRYAAFIPTHFVFFSHSFQSIDLYFHCNYAWCLVKMKQKTTIRIYADFLLPHVRNSMVINMRNVEL